MSVTKYATTKCVYNFILSIKPAYADENKTLKMS